jgi:hypothetical protein
MWRRHLWDYECLNMFYAVFMLATKATENNMDAKSDKFFEHIKEWLFAGNECDWTEFGRQNCNKCWAQVLKEVNVLLVHFWVLTG